MGKRVEAKIKRKINKQKRKGKKLVGGSWGGGREKEGDKSNSYWAMEYTIRGFDNIIIRY